MLAFPKGFATAVYCTFASEDMEYGDLGRRGGGGDDDDTRGSERRGDTE